MATTESRRRLAVALAAAALFAVPVAGCASSAGGTAAAGKAPRTDRATDPRAMKFEEPPFEYPRTDRAVLSNGIVVHMLRDASLPIVNGSAILRGGSVFDPEGKEGLASMASSMLRAGGTASLPIEGLEEELDLLAGDVSTSSEQESLGAGFSFLSKDLDRGLEVFADVLRNPAFDEGRFQQQKMIAIQNLQRSLQSPGGVMGRVFGGLVYGNHPYGRISTPKSIGSITPEDLRAFHAKWYHPDGMYLAVSGDFDRDRLLAQLEKAFAGWEPSKEPLPKLAPEVDPEGLPAGHFIVPMKSATQATIRMGHIGPKSATEDRVRFEVMNSIMGGGTFTSRMGLAVRNREGLAYSVGSGLMRANQGGVFLCYCDTKTQTSYRAIGLMREIMAGMRDQPVTQEELDIARESVLNGFVSVLESPLALARQRAILEFREYPEGWLERFREIVRSMTLEDVQAMAKKYLRPDRLRIVLVCNPADLDAAPADLPPAETIQVR